MSNAGCSGSVEPYVYEPDEAEQVQSRIADLEDAKRDPESFRARFTKGNSPDDRQFQEYQKHSFYAKSVEIDSDTATATVDVMHPETGDVQATVQWKLQRVDDIWLIAESPLP